MLRFKADDFVAKLPWFYHGLPFGHEVDHDVYSFEVNALDLQPGEYNVALVLSERREMLNVGFDGLHFDHYPASGDVVQLPPLDLSNPMISLYFRADEVGGPSPLREVVVFPKDGDLESARREAPVFDEYVRDTKASEREALKRWDEFYPLLMADGFSADDLLAMFHDLLGWCRRRQVTDTRDPHFGAIYSEEDKYDFRDAAAGAVAFTYAWRDSGDEDWYERARWARRYVYRGQHTEGERRGGWAHMVSGKWGGDLQVDFRRLTGPLPGVDGVDTAIIINLLCRAAELGLEPDEEDLQHIRLGAGWVAESEFEPGVFRHHEGAEHDCQNSNALGAMALARAHQTLERFGQEAPDAWLEAARRGLGHFVEGQEAIGEWPYVFATIGRGQCFSEHNVPDQGMGLYHFLTACETPGLRGTPGLHDALNRAARWYLCVSRIDERGSGPTIDLEYQRDGGGLLFSSFTWCRFMAAASLARIAEVTGEREPWRHLALRLMEHVRVKLWNTSDPDRAPVVRSARPDIELHSWIQAAEWDAILIRDIMEHLGPRSGKS